MSIDEIVEKATIKFPWDLTFEQSKGLIKYITIQLRGLITYEFLHSIKIGRQFGYPISSNEERMSNERGIIMLEEKISNEKGVITLSSPPFIFNNFKFKHSEKDTSRLSGIQFQLISDKKKLEDYRPEVRQLWDNTRKAVSDYFEENPE